MGWAAAAMVISAAATAYSVKSQQDASYKAQVRQNEQIMQQRDADAAARKAGADRDAMKARGDETKIRGEAADDLAKRAALAGEAEQVEAGETLLTGSTGVMNAMRKKTTLTGAY